MPVKDRAKDTIEGKVKSLSNTDLINELNLAKVFACQMPERQMTDWKFALQIEYDQRNRMGLLLVRSDAYDK